MPCELLAIVIAFAPLFTKPVFERVQVLVMGAMLSPNSRTVTQALRVMGHSDEQNFQKYHRVLNRADWSSFGCGCHLAQAVGQSLCAIWPQLHRTDVYLCSESSSILSMRPVISRARSSRSSQRARCSAANSSSSTLAVLTSTL